MGRIHLELNIFVENFLSLPSYGVFKTIANENYTYFWSFVRWDNLASVRMLEVEIISNSILFWIGNDYFLRNNFIAQKVRRNKSGL